MLASSGNELFEKVENASNNRFDDSWECKRALSLAFTHSLSLLGFFGGVVPPPLLPPPVSAVIMVEIRRTTLVKKAVMVPCRAL